MSTCCNSNQEPHDIIQFLCESVAPNYKLNQELLNNWQIELVEAIVDPETLANIIRNHVIIGINQDCTSLQFSNYEALIQRLNQLDDSIYNDFKLIILEILICLLNDSYNLRIRLFNIRLHHTILNEFLSIAKDIDIVITDTNNSYPIKNPILDQYARLLLLFVELGTDVEYLRKLITPLFNDSISSSKLIILELFQSLLQASSSHFKFCLFNNITSFPFTSNEVKKKLTIHSWFKINPRTKESDKPFTLFTISNSNGDDVSTLTTLKIQLVSYNQFMIELKNNLNQSTMRYTFNQILKNDSTNESSNYKNGEFFKNQGYTHFVLTYDTYCNLNLFINGEYSESIPCPDIQKGLHLWNKVTIGSEYSVNFKESDELLVRNLTILNTNISQEWVNLAYNLGLDFAWQHKELDKEQLVNLLNQLDAKSLINVGIKFAELREQNHDTKKFISHEVNGLESKPFNLKGVKQKRSGKFSISSSPIISDTFHQSKKRNMHSKIMDKSNIVNSLSTIKQDMILFDDNEFFQSFENQRKMHQSSQEVQFLSFPAYLFHNSESLHSGMHCIGGVALILKLLETSMEVTNVEMRDSMLYNLISILFLAIEGDWRLCKEFENLNGYGLLAIILTNYKENYNKSLTLNLLPNLNKNKFIEESTGCYGSNILNILLSRNGFNFVHSHDSMIRNKQCYQFLLLNFDLLFGTDSFKFLLYHYQILIESSRFMDYNKLELRRLRLLRRFVHFLKNPKLVSNTHESLEDQVEGTMLSILRMESSVETIRAVSTYIIFALYSDDCSTKYGVVALSSLSKVLCDTNSSIKTLKKFSRSISIHWILLLFKIKIPEVTLYGLKLLTKLLKSLGSNIIKRFFQVSHGLDILTQFLKHWWDNDRILSHIFLAAFGVESADSILSGESGSECNDLIGVLQDESFQSKQLMMPEFLLLLTNLMLNSIYKLNSKCGQLLNSNPSSPIASKRNDNLELKLNVLHVINEYTESVQIGFEKFPQLNQFYTSKEFLEGFFELLAYLRLTLRWSDDETHSRFVDSYSKMLKVVSDMIISRLPSNQIMVIFNKLNDFTKNMMLDLVFPKIFSHVNEFVFLSNFIFDEKGFLDSIMNILHCYQNNYLKKNFFIDSENLESFISCVFASIELSKSSSILKLKSYLGELIVLKFLKLAEYYENPQMDGTVLNETLKMLLYRQVTIFQNEVLDRRRLAEVFNILLGIFLQFSNTTQAQTVEYTFTFLRTLTLMNQHDMRHIAEMVSTDTDLIIELLSNLTTKNDEETLMRLKKYSTLTKQIIKNSKLLVSNYRLTEKLNLVDMLSVVLHNGGRLGDMDNVYIKSFERDCEILKSQLLHNEVISYNRVIQDNEENSRFFVSGYNQLKIELLRLIPSGENNNQTYTLDFIENKDRMRKRLVSEDQLPEAEKLSYNFTVPIRELETLDSTILEGHEDYEVLAIETLKSLNCSTSTETVDLEGEDPIQDESSTEEMDSMINEDRNRKVIRTLFMGDQINALWNVSEINGLVPIESLMILGTSHLYLIENYFHCPDGNVAEVKDAPAHLRDPILQLVNSQSSNVLKEDNNTHRSKNWSLEKLSTISKRQFLLRDIALEMFFSDGASILITCLTSKNRDVIYNKLFSHVSGYGLDSELTQALQISTKLFSSSQMYGPSYFASRFASAFSNTAFGSVVHLNATKKWKQGELSNFYYLMIINTLAGRTFNDLSQYPVFPWVIADYESKTLDLNDPKTFRDLSKPMGAQNATRAQQFKERYEAFASLQDENAPPCHYGTHYSSAMIVTSYLIRLKPFVHSYLLLQGGKFDHADRLFNSVARAWKSASQDVTTDVRELTPEFFYLPEFLTNSNNFEFGKLQSGQIANDVKLPPWANGDPNIFIAKNREALESPYVSKHLNQWIDLIFGYKQNGIEAINALNVFHPVSYNGAINLDNIHDEVEKRAIIGMINNFGQTPLKIFEKPHIVKEVLNSPNNYLSLNNLENKPEIIFESKLKAPIEKLEISSKANKQWIGRPLCIGAEDGLLIRKPVNFRNESKSLIINQTTFYDLQLSNITYILQIGNKMFLTGGDNGTINVWKMLLKPTASLQYQGVLRGHFSSIKCMKFSKSFKIGISCDIDGYVIVWDLVRFKFIRKFEPPKNQIDTFISISNDFGNICIIHYVDDNYVFNIFTINGNLILSETFDFGTKKITCTNFATINDPLVDNNNLVLVNNHAYWSNEILGVAMGKELKIYEIIPQTNGWIFQEIKNLNLNSLLHGSITTFEIFKRHEVDLEENLCHGSIKVVIGDYTGRVYSFH